MIRINQLKLPVSHTEADLKKKIAKMMHLREEQILQIHLMKQSIDARKKEELLYIYTVDIEIKGEEESAVKKAKNVNISLHQEKSYVFPDSGTESLKHRPVIIGCGPAGLFCGLMLARAGYHPLLLERGEDVDTRRERVKQFWQGGTLMPNSNVQFGEGGAGTFSDGKLNTLVKDPDGRNKKVLEILVEAGGDPSILYKNKPHIGTDVLGNVVKNIRSEILRLGGEVRFNSQVSDIIVEQGSVTGLVVNKKQLPAKAVVLAVGHSARDTFEMLNKKEILMQAKSFAVGLRIQHSQKQINLSQYGMEEPGELGAASYKLTSQTSMGRGVYSFCMCPGGYVVNASSEEKRLAVNGMSNHSREGENANSALIVTVSPEDFLDATPLGGIAFQRKLEEAAYECANGKIPVQLYGDFRENKKSTGFGSVNPAFKGQFSFGNLREIFPESLSVSFIEAMEQFGHKIQGFDRYDAILAGIESRTSSPLRILRDKKMESSIKGLYPCGEGAGYAGGITSAAMDGIKMAETLASRFSPLI